MRMVCVESRFQVLTVAEEEAVVRARVRERCHGVRLCARVAAASVAVALVAAGLSPSSEPVAWALPLFFVIAALACALLVLVQSSRIAWRLRLARLDGAARGRVADWNASPPGRLRAARRHGPKAPGLDGSSPAEAGTASATITGG
jgi:hypothetical protein